MSVNQLEMKDWGSVHRILSEICSRLKVMPLARGEWIGVAAARGINPVLIRDLNPPHKIWHWVATRLNVRPGIDDETTERMCRDQAGPVKTVSTYLEIWDQMEALDNYKFDMIEAVMPLLNRLTTDRTRGVVRSVGGHWFHIDVEAGDNFATSNVTMIEGSQRIVRQVDQTVIIDGNITTVKSYGPFTMTPESISKRIDHRGPIAGAIRLATGVEWRDQ